ncbi:Golgi transport complex subunit 1 [Boothiomyces macroporosus]|uniref:Conserved oligomeric Golgi complex subunit 1 n=1 Tax=Boothiomyces macroporosus TaxID=261099 RepID=A0AAD5Y8Z8_9FUNG|nr:Golgi transport complex subunit 1 [Boothiomyces macroporosus]
MEEDKVDAEILFQKHHVDELRSILLKIKDVIDAADAVGQMKQSTEELISSFKSIQDICRQSNIGSISSKQDSSAPGKSRLKIILVTLYPIAAQIRLLVVTPEHIWNATESGQFVTASRYYMIAKLVYSNIQSSTESMAAKYKTNFPVVKRQWEAIAPLKAQIVEKAISSVGMNDLREEKLLDALAAIGILENNTDSDLIQIFLKQRKKVLLEKLDLKEADPTVMRSNLMEVTKIIKFTVSCIHSLFYSNTDGSKLKNYLPSIFDARADISMSAFVKLYSENTNMSLLFRYLPASVKKYYPTMNTKTCIDNAALLQLSATWIDNVKSQVGSKLSGLLSKISKGTDLIEISDSVFRNIQSDFDNNESWLMLSTQLYATKTSLWTLLFHEKFIECCTAIIENVFRNIFTKKDVGNFLWGQKLGNFNLQTTSIDTIGQSQTPVIAEIQRKIHHSADLIHKDIQSMIVFYTNLISSLSAENNSKIQTDLEQLGKATQNSFEFALESYTHYLSEQLTGLENASATSDRNQDLIYLKMIFIGRVSKVVLELSKELLVLFDSANLLEGSRKTENSPEGHLLAKGLDELYVRSHKLWISFVSSNLYVHTLQSLKAVNWETCIQFRSLWEAPESGGDQIPIHPSNNLTEGLFDLCRSINQVDGFNMDQRCILLLLKASFNQIVKAYRELLHDQSTLRSKDGDLQLYFDLEFIAKTIGQCGTTVEDFSERNAAIASLKALVDKVLAFNCRNFPKKKYPRLTRM